MNKRIKQLAEQAGMEYNSDHQFDAFNEEKFAELIINDCLDLIKSKTGGEYHIGMSAETRRAWTIWILLKERFGIK